MTSLILTVRQNFFTNSTISRGTDAEIYCKNTKTDYISIWINYLTEIIKRKIKFKIIFSPPGGARELKIRPFDSESNSTSGCSKSLTSKKLTPNSLFSFYQNKFDFSYQGGVVDQIVSNRIYTAQIQNLVIKWEKKNQLMMPRRNHNSIRYARDLLFHVGGQNRMYEFYEDFIHWNFLINNLRQTSRWELEFQGYGSVTKNESWPFLDNYIDPSLFPVDFNECSG